MASKRQRENGTWEYVVKRKDLLPAPVWLTFPDEQTGDAAVKIIEAKLDLGIVPPELVSDTKGKYTVADMIDLYRGAVAIADTEGPALTIVRNQIGTVMLDDVNYVWVEAWVAAMKARRLAPGTIRKRVGSFSRVLNWAVTKGYVASNPTSALTKGYAKYPDGSVVDTHRDRRLSEDEEAAVREVLSKKRGGEERTLLFDLALETAMRMSEMLWLKWDQIDLKRRTIFLDKTKNGKKRQVPMSSVVTRLLGGKKQGGPLFSWFIPPEKKIRRRTVRDDMSSYFGEVFAEAGCPDETFHDLRHEATSRLFERTKLSDVEIMKITGHSSPQMLARYANLRASDLAQKLW
jgi:integrase